MTRAKVLEWSGVVTAIVYSMLIAANRLDALIILFSFIFVTFCKNLSNANFRTDSKFTDTGYLCPKNKTQDNANNKYKLQLHLVQQLLKIWGRKFTEMLKMLFSVLGT